MKNNDHSFTFLTAIILAGVLAACLPSGEASPGAAEHNDHTAPAMTSMATTTSADSVGAQP